MEVDMILFGHNPRGPRAAQERGTGKPVANLSRRLVAETFGTLWLVLGGAGSAVLAARFPEVGIGLLGVSFAFGLTVLTMAYAVGHISGGHFNPAVSFGLWSAGQFRTRDLLPYIAAQVLGGALGGGLLYLIASGRTGFNPAEGFAPLVIGFALTLIHLISIPVTNTSVNPARSTGVAVIARGWALGQLWLFWLAPMVGGALGGIFHRIFEKEGVVEAVEAPPAAAPRPA
ncbi:MAG: Major intrinsic protein [Fibrobacteres bacterium]|nr:Major intrinsic protein [Fibrobacterota bacterium]